MILSDCPCEEELRSFAVGAMSGLEFENMAQHVEECPACNQRLDSLEDSQGNSGFKVQLHGLHPWRPRPAKDAFQLKALSVLQERAQRGELELSFHEFPVNNGRQSLRYAKGQIMKESCVTCHNGAEASPKRDWKVGDLVGILEVTRPLDRETERTRAGLRSAFVLIGGTGILMAGLSFALVLAARLRSQRKVNR